VQIDEQRLETAAFLCIEKKTSAGKALVPHATVFFVGDTDVEEPHPVWAVTARHCIQEARAAKTKVAVRVNAGDSYIDVPTDPQDWTDADDSDVSCCYWASTEGEVVAVPLKQLIAEDYTYRFGQLDFEDGNEGWGPAKLHVGADVFFVGLFSQHAGRARNLPIARFGNVSRLPRESITVKRPWGAEQIEGILVEARSWGGHSGSPAYWAQPFTKVIEIQRAAPPLNRAERRAGRQSPPPLSASREEHMVTVMGLVSAHFDIPRDADTVGDVLGKVTTPVNSGIAVITPAHFITRLLDREDVREDAEKYRREYNPAAPATMDILGFAGEGDGNDEATPDENPEYENFEDAMTQLVQTPKPPAE
jgi:hypothetical protein